MVLGAHSGTHFNAPHHWITGKDYEDGYTDTLNVQRLIAPVNVIDCSKESAADPDFLLTADAVKAWESKHGEIGAGEWVVLRSDWDKRAHDEAAFLNADDTGPHSPGPTPDCVDYLLSKKIVGWGSQCIGTDVDEILVEDGKVRGVKLKGGEEIGAGNVAASVTPSQLYLRLLRAHVDKDTEEAAENYRYGHGNFQLHYALEAQTDWSNDELNQTALIHLSDGIDAVSKSANEAERGLLPQTPSICVGQPAGLDPSRCPEGKSILWLQIPDAPRLIKGDAASKIDTSCGHWDEDLREAFADRIENILRAHIKNFDKIRLTRRAYSPADLEAMNINLVGGDPYGGMCSIDQFFIWRPFKDSHNSATSIKGLYHIGASTHPGPGLGGGSGYLFAKKMGA